MSAITDYENRRHRPERDPRGVRWALLACVAFWGFILLKVFL